jgi:hypothetical protein
MFGYDAQISGLKKTFQQKDGFVPAHLAQAHGAFKLNQRQSIRIGKPTHATRQAMPVRVGFDYTPYFGLGCAFFCDSEVVLHGSDINGGDKRSGHGAVLKVQ